MRLHWLIIVAIYQHVNCNPTNGNLELFTAEDEYNQNKPADNNGEKPLKSISELVLEQTEQIKKIVAEQNQPKLTHQHISTNLQTTNNPKDQESEITDELRTKCQLLKSATKSDNALSTNPVNPFTRLDLLGRKPTFSALSPYQANGMPQITGNYFIFPQNPQMFRHGANQFADNMEVAASSNEEIVSESEESVPEPEVTTLAETTTATSQVTSPVSLEMKYVRLEPIVEQKTILANGKTVYHWYRLLPTTQSFVQMPDTPENADIDVVAQPQNIHFILPLPKQYRFYLNPQNGRITENVQPNQIDATTTVPIIDAQPPAVFETRPQFYINPQTGMIYQTALPHQFIYHKRTPSTLQTTTQKIEMTTTESPNFLAPSYSVEIPQQTNERKTYKDEFRFVLPMPLRTKYQVSNYPNEVDLFAYMPKDKQPEMMNIPVPYAPNYHMIRTLTIPKIEN